MAYAQEGGADCSQKGWKGMVEFAGGKGMGFQGTSRVMLSGIGGYQFNPTVFAGAGFGYDFKNKIKVLFADARVSMDMKISPYAELRAGMNLDDTQFYICPAVGCRYALDNGLALYVGLGVDFTKTTHNDAVPVITYYNSTGQDISMSNISSVADNYSLCLKVGIEF